MLRGGVTGWTMCWLCRRTQLAGLEGHECDQNQGSGLPGLEGGVQGVRYTAHPPGWEDRDVTSGVRTLPLVSPPWSPAPDWER